MKIFVVHLKGSDVRYKNFVEGMSKFPSLNYEIFDAVNGKELSAKDEQRVYHGDEYIIENNFISKVTIKGNLSPGEVGCSFSHVKIYERIVRDKLSGAIVLEDDFSPLCDITEVFGTILKKIPDADIINGLSRWSLGTRQSFFSRIYTCSTSNGFKYKYTRAGVPYLDWFFNRRRRVNSTVCYYISNKGCKRLLELAYPIRMEADRLLGMIAYNHLKTIIIEPALGTFETPDGSVIGDSRHQKAY